jgi:acyl carrier protein
LTEQQFLAGFADAVGSAPEALTFDTPLSSLENWDSVAYLSVMTMVDEHMGVALDPEKLTQAKTPGEIYRLASA